MQSLIVGAVAVLVGIVVGFWLRSTSAKAEKAQLEQRNRELADELGAERRELAQLRIESAGRAGFESLAAERKDANERLIAERDELQLALDERAKVELDQAATVSRLESELKSERDGYIEKLKILTDARVALTDQFKAIAGEILDDKSAKFTTANKENLDQILSPLRVQINDFRTKVEEAQKENIVGRTELSTELKQLKILNDRLSNEAHSLSTALRGSKSDQGIWGEEVARDLLEVGGLREGVQYRLQQSFDAHTEDDASRRSRPRPDIVVNLPGGRNLVVDSKVSLNAYWDSVKAQTDEEQLRALERHVSDIRKHIRDLAERKYHKLLALESPDFVVMFVPIEPAFLSAIHHDPSLWRFAYEKNILLVGPTTLLFVIRIVDNLWRQELKSKSIDKVIRRGEELYDKFVGFVTDLSKVGDSLRDAEKSYLGAMNKLTSGRENLVWQTEKLKEFGISTKKQLPAKLLEAAGLDSAEQEALSLAASGETTPEINV